MATGFVCVNDGGWPPYEFTVANDEVIGIGEILTLTSNEAAKGTTNDTTFIGASYGTIDNSADGEVIRAYCHPYAIYAFEDGTAHAAGATLDLGSDGRGLASSSNADFTVVADNAATEPTLVCITPGEHYLHGGG